MMDDKILLAHGSGGQTGHRLVSDFFARYFDNAWLAKLDDAAVFVLPATDGETRLALTTDSYVVQPVFFPGGDIGKLAICGTVNDLAVMGAHPLYLTAGFIIEEGFPLADLERIVESMARTAREASVYIVTGDTKVVERGSADGVFINTAGVGALPAGVHLSGTAVRPGDALILSGSIGDHGMAIMSQREGLRFTSPLQSDCAPLNGLIAAMLAASSNIHCMRDPTRGGLATTLNEIAASSDIGIEIEEEHIPIKGEVSGVCEMLGLDPLYVANEGKLVAFVAPEDAGAVLQAMRLHPYGREARIIGRAHDSHPGRVVLRTILGMHRIVNMLTGDQLPRIC